MQLFSERGEKMPFLILHTKKNAIFKKTMHKLFDIENKIQSTNQTKKSGRTPPLNYIVYSNYINYVGNYVGNVLPLNIIC